MNHAPKAEATAEELLRIADALQSPDVPCDKEIPDYNEDEDIDTIIAALRELAAIKRASAGDAQVTAVVEAARNVECGCSVAERDSGHRVGCGMPDLHDAIATYDAYAATLEAKPERATQAQVTRYDMKPIGHGEFGHLIWNMGPRNDGAYVLWDDVAPLLREATPVAPSAEAKA